MKTISLTDEEFDAIECALRFTVTQHPEFSLRSAMQRMIIKMKGDGNRTQWEIKTGLKKHSVEINESALLASLIMKDAEPAGEVFGMKITTSKLLPPDMMLVGYPKRPELAKFFAINASE